MTTGNDLKFSDYMDQVVRHGYIALGLSIGGRLGLFKLMASFSEAKTAQEVADVGGFKERYVREWLNLMTAAKIVQVDQEGRKFLLPKEHHETLLRDFSPAEELSILPILGEVEDKLMDCFSTKGQRGLPYSLLPRFPTWMENYTMMRLKVEGDVYEKIPKLHQKLEQGALVADLGCGEGRITIHMAKQYPKSTFYGLDNEASVVKKGRDLINQESLNNIHMEVQDICSFPAEWTNKWDCVLFHYSAHDVPYTTKCYEEAMRTLKPGGVLVICDANGHTNVVQNLNLPAAVSEYCISLFSCIPCSMVADGGEGLGSLWGKELAMDMARNAGFQDVQEAYDGPFSYFIVGTKCD